MTIGIIDDNLVYRFVVRTLIRATSPATLILELKDGQEAIEFFNQNVDEQSQLPDIILLDINMPKLNGWQFLDQLRNSNIAFYRPFIYMVSSSTDEIDIATSNLYQEVTRFISKPIRTEMLREIISEAMAGL